MNDEEQAARYREQDERSTQQRAALLGLSYVDTRSTSQTSALVPDILTIDAMYRNRLVPLRVGSEEHSFLIGITTGTPQSFVKAFQKEYSDAGKTITYVLISDSGFREYMRRYDPPKEVHYDDVEIAKAGDSDTLASVSKTLESVSIDKILDYLINQADKLGASDIHMETQRENVRIRMRIDGALHPVAEITLDKYRVLQGAIATRANISTAAIDPQTGHMQQDSEQHPGRLINMRIETVPTVYGMDLVIRLFTFDEGLLQVDKLGLDAGRMKEINDVIAHPHGMVMIVGPTGSGKSTTLYSIINALNDPSRKILTLEDPVEISLPGVTQIPIRTNEGGNFADGLRAVLRLDPDVIMVGEIRDADTAKTAIQASITGHLVLTTFHASTAAAAFSRMIDMIGQNPIFANAIRMVIAQRLVRRLDDATKEEFEPDETTKQWIRDSLKDLPERTEKPNLDQIKLWKPVVSAGSPFGYKGRIMIMEQLMVSEEIQKFIRGEMKDINVSDIENMAKSQGMLTMLQDGILKALKGETTLEEINRVI